MRSFNLIFIQGTCANRVVTVSFGVSAQRQNISALTFAPDLSHLRRLKASGSGLLH